MICKTSHLRYEMAVRGNTGYDNKSSILLKLKGIGELKLPFKEWDLSQIPIDSVESITLKVPSGLLVIEEITSVIKDAETIVFCSESAEWNGKVDGFYGGMSGYGWWTFDKKSTYVFSGVYLASDRCFNTFPVPLSEYEGIKRFHQETSPLWKEEAARIGQLLAKLNDLAGQALSEDELNELLNWWEKIS